MKKRLWNRWDLNPWLSLNYSESTLGFWGWEDHKRRYQVVPKDFWTFRSNQWKCCVYFFPIFSLFFVNFFKRPQFRWPKWRRFVRKCCVYFFPTFSKFFWISFNTLTLGDQNGRDLSENVAYIYFSYFFLIFL